MNKRTKKRTKKRGGRPNPKPKSTPKPKPKPKPKTKTKSGDKPKPNAKLTSRALVPYIQPTKKLVPYIQPVQPTKKSDLNKIESFKTQLTKTYNDHLKEKKDLLENFSKKKGELIKATSDSLQEIQDKFEPKQNTLQTKLNDLEVRQSSSYSVTTRKAWENGEKIEDTIEVYEDGKRFEDEEARAKEEERKRNIYSTKVFRFSNNLTPGYSIFSPLSSSSTDCGMRS